MTTARSDAIRQWIETNAHPLATTAPAEPLTDLKPLAAMLADAAIVGIGETTRAAHEVVSLGHRVLRLLVDMGFRVLAIQDDESAVETLNDYLRTGDGDPDSAIAELWRPWRTSEMAEMVSWARSFNEQHPHDPFRVVGLDPPSARQANYQAVLDHVADEDSEIVDAIRRHYDAIVTAHEVPEHVQLARSSHPGRPFVDHARDAYRLVAGLPESAARSAALDNARLIVDFHAGSFAGGGFDYAVTRQRAVATMTSLVGDGAKVAYWEGIAFTANAARLEPVALLDPFQSVGNELRQQLGNRYVSLLIEFGGGDISRLHPGQHAPAAMAGSVNADLAAAEPDRYLLDLHAPRQEPVDDWLRGTHRLRVIGGIYEATADHEHYLTTGPLDEWFDAVLHVRTVGPTTLL
ncbi:erythromycin esterase family protein [Plantactinospora sp. CA-290183]|uniref:erythromycin esterase family protein n=1 Tax=Plantactinospora sp. CA-290183 TaxID=3240006 RepID=UPI003D901C39